MSDTWATLEQRFRNLADKSPELIIEASPSESEWKTVLVKGPFGTTSQELVLSGWNPTEAGWESESGVWNWYVSGPKGALHIEELELLIHRADRLLNHHTQYKSRFLNFLVSQYGKAGNPSYMQLKVLHETRPPFSFYPGADLCALTAGYLLNNPDLTEASAANQSDDWSAGRSKTEWLALKHMTTDQWNAMRKANTGRIQHVQGNQRSWQFKRSLCIERGFHCSEFTEK